MSLFGELPLAGVRYAAAFLAVLGVVAAWLGWKRLAIVATLLAVGVSVGHRVTALGRPYGLLFDPQITLERGRMAVAWALGDSRAEVLSHARSPGADVLTTLAAAGVSPRAVSTVRQFLPIAGLLLSAAALGWLGRTRGKGGFAVLAAGFWLVLSTGDLETLRGVGFLPGIWSHGVACVLLVCELVVLAAFGAQRVATPPVFAGALLAAPWFVIAPLAGEPDLAPTSVLLLLTFDQGLLGCFAVLGARQGSAAGRVLGGVGALLLVIHGASGHLDPWGPAALYRAGLVLLAVPGLERLFLMIGHEAARQWAPAGLHSGRVRASAAATAIGLFVAITGSFVLWWNPGRLDPVALESIEPIPNPVTAATEWIRTRTGPVAVFVASPGLAPAVSALGQRQVVRSPTLLVAEDDHQRRRAERVLLLNCDLSDFPRRYGVTHVLVAPGDFREYGIRWPDQLEEKPCFRGVYTGRSGYRVFEVVGEPR